MTLRRGEIWLLLLAREGFPLLEVHMRQESIVCAFWSDVVHRCPIAGRSATSDRVLLLFERPQRTFSERILQPIRVLAALADSIARLEVRGYSRPEKRAR